MGWGSIIGGGLGAGAGAIFGGPLGAGVGMGLGGAVGGALEGAFEDEDPVAPVQVDPSLYSTPGYDQYLAGVDGRQAGYEGRAAPQLDWSQANADRQLALQARDYQDQAAQSYLDVLSGKAPSLAQQQLQQGLTTANAQAMQQAASVRGGPGNLLLANQQAQRQGAANSLAANAAASQLRAREMDLARQGLLSSGSQMRGQDLEMRGQSQGQVKMGADVELAQTGLNDAMVRQLEQARMAALQGQQQGRSDYAGAVYGAQTGVQNINAQIQRDNAQRDRDMTAGIMQTGGQIAAMGMQKGGGGAGGGAGGGSSLPLGGDTASAGPITDSDPSGGAGGGSDVVDPWAPGASTYTPGQGGQGSGYSAGGGYGQTDPSNPYGNGKYKGYAPYKGDEP